MSKVKGFMPLVPLPSKDLERGSFRAPISQQILEDLESGFLRPVYAEGAQIMSDSGGFTPRSRIEAESILACLAAFGPTNPTPEFAVFTDPVGGLAETYSKMLTPGPSTNSYFSFGFIIDLIVPELTTPRSLITIEVDTVYYPIWDLKRVIRVECEPNQRVLVVGFHSTAQKIGDSQPIVYDWIQCPPAVVTMTGVTTGYRTVGGSGGPSYRAPVVMISDVSNTNPIMSIVLDSFDPN